MTDKPRKNCFSCGTLCYGYQCRECFTSCRHSTGRFRVRNP
jgi:hypothetical protein